MATEVAYGTSVEVNTIAADWDWAAYRAADPKPKLAYIMFRPGLATDLLIVKDGSDAGPVIFNALCPDMDEKIKYFHGSRKRPYIDFSDCSFNVGHLVLIGLWPSKR